MAQRLGQKAKDRLRQCTDTQLVQQWHAGVPGAAEILLPRHYKWLEQHFRKRLRASAVKADVQDLCQSTLLRLTISIQSLRSASSFPGFLRKIAKWTFYDWLRKKYRRERSIDASGDPGDSIDAASSRADTFDEESIHRRNVLGGIPREELDLLLRYYLEPSSSKELASELERHPTTLRVGISRAKVMLANHLRDRRPRVYTDRSAQPSGRPCTTRRLTDDKARRARPRRSRKLERP